MVMTKRSLGRALRALESDLVNRKRKVDEELQAVRVVIRINDQRDDDAKQAISFAAEIGNTIYAVLKDESPLHRNEIMARVKERGVHIGGANPSNNLGTYLSRDERFENVSKGVWRLAEEDSTVNPESNGHGDIDLAALVLS